MAAYLAGCSVVAWTWDTGRVRLSIRCLSSLRQARDVMNAKLGATPSSEDNNLLHSSLLLSAYMLIVLEELQGLHYPFSGYAS